ncbi:SOS response associated peptidase (SRAP) [Popillia japonica]|uniref:Abasic site processing protein HMCES n=1 Tax=Popillia japonica TaxID=7064 RepID=A0AAW1LZ97_POPJA
MCGRVACTLCPEDIPKSCGINDRNGKSVEPKWSNDSQYTYKPFYNGPPTTTVPVVLYDSKKSKGESGNYSLVPMKWGFTPNFPVNSQALAHTHNARVENVVNSNMYRSSLISNGRCIVVIEGFYEWQTTPGAGNKQPYFIYQNPYETDVKSEDSESNNKYLMKMAGLWTSKKTPDGVQYSCTIFTTESDKTLSWLHHRMPIILNTSDEINDWLDYENVTYAKILPEIKKSFWDRTRNELKLKHYTVDKSYVNKSTCNDPKCMAKYTVKRPNTLDNWLSAKKKK